MNPNTPKFRAVLITGGSRGIGQATVTAFARAGYRVAFCYRESKEQADAVVRALQAEGLNVCGYRCDIADEDAVSALYAETKRTFGTVDTLINNAGIAHRSLVGDETAQSIVQTLSVNLAGAVNLCRLYAPDMVRTGFGRIVNVSSIFASRGASMESVYAAAKGGTEAFTKSLAKELGLSGVTVNAVAPGLIATDMNGGLSKAERVEFLKTVALGRAGTPEEVANLILFLAGESAGYITGQVIGIDGGI